MKTEVKGSYIRYIMIAGGIIILAVVGYFVKNLCSGFSGGANKAVDKKENIEVLYDEKDDKNSPAKGSTTLLTVDKNISMLKVEIKGAVLKPGVYAVGAEDRVEDLVKLAGGFLANADKVRIRLADRLTDEEVIYVYKTGEKLDKELLEIGINNHSSIEKDNKGQEKKSGKININIATKEQLMTLTGIGEVKANSIIAYREEHNGFKSLDELKNVSGIGEKTLSKFAHLVDIN